MESIQPKRGEVWIVDLGRTRGHEQAGSRPALVVSVDRFNHGPAGLVVILPITTRHKRVPFHVQADPPEGGLRESSFIKCEDVRSVSKARLTDCWGSVSPSTIAAVENRLRTLFGL
ncbi:MAG: type II toxin-antitoxin system PemK/MazF family toxin [bacterium]|nr:type II toxin-antitoxin system PemK/MazF family toxin [bacterium]